MKLTRTLIAAAIAVLASGALADDSHHSGTADKPAAQQPNPHGARGTPHMGTMRDNMKRMQEQMREIVAASDPEERQRLMSEHMKSMQESMPMMRGGTGGEKGASADVRAKNMAQCMEMMQQMVHRQGAEQPAQK